MSKLVTAYTCGVFDHFHIGHLNFISDAAKVGILTVGIQDDRDVYECKKVKPTFPLADRMAIVSALSCVSRVISYRDSNQSAWLEADRPTYFVVGEEYGQDERFPGQAMTLVSCHELGIRVERIKRTQGISSTLLRKNARSFWETYAKLNVDNPKDSITTLTQEDPLLTNREVDWILTQLGPQYARMHVVDLGAGDGRLARPLADKVAHVNCVEPVHELVQRCKARSTSYQAAHLSYYIMPALAYLTTPRNNEDPYPDAFIISGLLPYLTDEEVVQLGVELRKYQNIQIFLREPMSTTGERIVLSGLVNQSLGFIPYTATYRTFIDILKLLQMCVVKDSGQNHQTHKDTGIRLVTIEPMEF